MMFHSKVACALSRVIVKRSTCGIFCFTAPLNVDFTFRKIFQDKSNMRHLLNSIQSDNAGKGPISSVDNIEISEISTKYELQRNERTFLYDCMCTFSDNTIHKYKLIRANKNASIASSDAFDFTRMDYWYQWHKYNAFPYKIHVAVMLHDIVEMFSDFNFLKHIVCTPDLRHTCRGLYCHPPVMDLIVFNTHAAPAFVEQCTTDLQRWCVLIRDANQINTNHIPGVFQTAPYHHIWPQLDMRAMTHEDRGTVLDQWLQQAERTRAALEALPKIRFSVSVDDDEEPVD